MSEPWWPTAWGPKGNRWSLLSWGCCLGTAIGCARGENFSNVSSKRHARKKTILYNLKNIPSRHGIFRFESGRPWWHIHWTTLQGQELPVLAQAWEKSFAYGLQSRLPSPKELRYFLCVDPLLYPLHMLWAIDQIAAQLYTQDSVIAPYMLQKKGNLCKRAQHNSTSLKQEPATLGHSHVLRMQRDDDTQRMGDGELKFNWKRKVCPTCPKKWNQVWWVWCFFWNSGFSKTCRWCLPVMFRKKGPTKMHFDWTFFQSILGWKSISLPLCRTAISHASAPGIQNQLMRENDCRREMASKIWRL